ncbi:GNAT family N-acetyltransferase [Microterricola pindariensis]|uniref:GNAT family N-acetyltransferase n=1 Tax=Microterricola pindariensis TaxID=478010 RepID=A0ABX5B0W8_9MICO|nr:GNAT family N-acetyltransferase [Microterricola pindariensis]PPL20516.1 GNAT family N-acetyltransferase [Microterricola pindariensis]
MTVQIRPIADGDFFNWIGLYEGYNSFYNKQLTDQKALILWSWLVDKNHESFGYVAEEDGELIGLAHLREFARPLDASRGLFLDDLYVADSARGNGVGAALLETAKDYARENRLSVVRWISASDNEVAQLLYDKVAERTDWVTYDMDPNAEGGA